MGGFYAILSYERHEIREKVEQKIIESLNKSELICIVANTENLLKMNSLISNVNTVSLFLVQQKKLKINLIIP